VTVHLPSSYERAPLSHKRTPRTRQSLLTLAAFRPWGSSQDGRRAGSAAQSRGYPLARARHPPVTGAAQVRPSQPTSARHQQLWLVAALAVTSPAEDSPSGLWRTIGNRVGADNPSRVQIPHPPPPTSTNASHHDRTVNGVRAVRLSLRLSCPRLRLPADVGGPTWYRRTPGRRARNLRLAWPVRQRSRINTRATRARAPGIQASTSTVTGSNEHQDREVRISSTRHAHTADDLVVLL
jgi:hypothetical protein